MNIYADLFLTFAKIGVCTFGGGYAMLPILQRELVQLRRLSMALMNRIQSNYRFVIGFNGGLIALGALGVLAPATSATLHNLSTLGISLRSMTSLLPPAKA